MRLYLSSDGIGERAGALLALQGGNAFTLRRAMRLSGFDRIIVEMLERHDIVHGGFSAGVAPTLRGIELMGDPGERPAGYAPELVWDGLGLIVYPNAPHHRSRHPGAAAAELASKHLAACRCGRCATAR